MQAITIRPYRLDDVESLVALFQTSVRQIALGDYTEAQVRAWAPDLHHGPTRIRSHGI